jgi:hypothetical protein
LRTATAPAAARAEFADRRAAAARPVALRDAAWDEAFAVASARGLGDLAASAQVVARVSNIVLETTYQGGESAAERGRRAAQAARWAAARLR